MQQKDDKIQLFESVPVPKALSTLAIPTIISQLINLVYNMVDAFFIGRTGNSYMMAATTLALTLVLLNIAFGNLWGIGGGSLIARLMGMQRNDEGRHVSAFSLYGAVGTSLIYSLILALFMEPILYLFGASEATIGFAKQYLLFVLVIGNLPTLLSMVLSHLLRNTGHAAEASMGLSGGGILNMILDPVFMFVILPKGYEVMGAAIATMLSNTASCLYLLYAFFRASKKAPLSLRLSDARKISGENIKNLFYVGVPSAILTGLFDLANIFVNKLAASHNDLVLAGLGIVMKIGRIPNAINVGICQGMLPIVAYNYTSGKRARMKETIATARKAGITVSVLSILLLEVFARPAAGIFLSTSDASNAAAITTVAYAAHFLRIHALASPMQFLNYNTSYCMQAMGYGRETMLHAVVRELVFYIPLMFVLDRIFGETGLAAALPVGEACGAVFALLLLRHILNRGAGNA